MKINQGRRIYLLPNLLTTAGLFAAFYAIISATQAKFELAAIAILVAMIADVLDGRVARLTGAQSSFGAEYDSLSDIVSFGVAPALLVYGWSLATLGKLGWLIAFIYTASVALRLAKFNIQIDLMDKRFFKGLACPAGAGIMASIIWFCQVLEIDGASISFLIVVISIIVSILMVSNVRYYSFKELDFKKSLPSMVALFVVLLFVGISLNPPLVLLIGFSIYVVSGPVYTLMLFQRTKKARAKATS